jgi:alpha-beta hydrolase superfamily lysophospholipase
MRTIENSFVAPDGENIFYYQFLPDCDEVKFVFQIIHGMAEHSDRYKNFAEFLTNNGAAVYISDLRGHGKNCKDLSEYGVWKDKAAWLKIIDDIKILKNIANTNHPDTPYFALGHSMGSFLLRALINNNSHEIDGVILSGTGYYPTYILRVATLLISISSIIRGSDYKSKFIYNTIFRNFNKGFKKPYQWLTHDDEIVDKYNADPLSGGIMSNSFYKCFCKGLMQLNKRKKSKNIRKDLPVAVIAGTGDPVSSIKGVEKIVDFYTNIGIENLDVKFYDGGRHEMLNEYNKDEVYNDIYQWTKSVLVPSAMS